MVWISIWTWWNTSVAATLLHSYFDNQGELIHTLTQ
jgi:hypothetical protein